MIVVEHVSSLEIPEVLGKFSLDKTRKFGKSALSYYSYKSKIDVFKVASPYLFFNSYFSNFYFLLFYTVSPIRTWSKQILQALHFNIFGTDRLGRDVLQEFCKVDKLHLL